MPNVDAGVIDEARARQCRHRTWAGAATVAALMAAALVALISPSGVGPGPSGVGAPAGGQTVRAGPLTVTLPAGWQWRTLQGGYRDCTNPIIALTLASYRRPALLVRQGGGPAVIVPANGVILTIEFAPIRSLATPWKHWQLSNQALRPYHPVVDPLSGRDPNRIRAETALPRSAAMTASAVFGSLPMPGTALAAANRVLHSIRVNRSYPCLPGPPPRQFTADGR